MMKMKVQGSLRRVGRSRNQSAGGGRFDFEGATGSGAGLSPELDGPSPGDLGSARRNLARLYGGEPFHILTFFWGPAV